MLMTEQVTNWAGNVVFSAERFHRPATVPELQSIVARSTRARALGTGHAFSRLADTDGDLIAVGGLPRVTEVTGGTVTVSAGLSYGEVAAALNRAGRALPNLASLPHISVAGACASGTHGSGDINGGLATAVSAIEMVTADGDLMTVSRRADPGRFPGMVVALGALGIVTRVTLDTLSAFDVRQYVYEDLPYEQVTAHFGEIMSAAYSVSLFTDWRGPRMRQAWLKYRADDPRWSAPRQQWLGATLADGPRHPVPGMSPESCTQQLGIPGPWHERLPHFRVEFTPSAGSELQSEFLLPRAHATRALLELDQVASQLAPVTQISEIRTVAADELWLSPGYLQDSVAFHFTWISDAAAVAPVLALVEERLMPLHGRPHWGKLQSVSPETLRERYPRLRDFRQLMHLCDPSGKFRNGFTDRYLSLAHQPGRGSPGPR
jgi:alditol oxidase